MKGAIGPVAILVVAVAVLTVALFLSLLQGTMLVPTSILPTDVDFRARVAIAVVTCYLLLALAVRALFVAPTTRRHLMAQINGAKARLRIDQDNADLSNPTVPQVAKDARSLLLSAERDNPIGLAHLLSMVFWNGSSELQGWRLAHEAERLLITQWDREQIYARLRRAEIEIQDLPPVEAKGWQKVLETHLGAAPDQTEKAKADLREILGWLHNRADSSFASLIELQNKSMWLLMTGLVAAAIIALAFPNQDRLLLVGAVGGLLNRMRRVYTAKTLPTDYGASWVPLFLSPVVGALTGWAGVQLLVLLQLVDIVNLSVLDLGNTAGAGALAAALVMGFAEQWFDRVSGQVEEITSAKPKPESDGG